MDLADSFRRWTGAADGANVFWGRPLIGSKRIHFIHHRLIFRKKFRISTGAVLPPPLRAEQRSEHGHHLRKFSTPKQQRLGRAVLFEMGHFANQDNVITGLDFLNNIGQEKGRNT